MKMVGDGSGGAYHTGVHNSQVHWCRKFNCVPLDEGNGVRMKYRNLKRADLRSGVCLPCPDVEVWVEYDEHGMNICGKHPVTGEVYEWSGIRRRGALEPCAPKVE